MSEENYLTHPHFGLLFCICPINEAQDLYTTLYAQRVFFLVNLAIQPVNFTPIPRADARLLVEQRLRQLRQEGNFKAYKVLQDLHNRTF